MIQLFSVGFFFAWSAGVAIADCRDRRIPNQWVLVGLVAGIVFTISRHNPFGTTLSGSLIGGLAGFASLFPFFILRVMGAADVKIFAVLGVWCGLPVLPWLWIAASIAAGVHALGVVLSSRLLCGAPALALGARRATPYAAFLVAPAAAWLAYLVHIGGVR
ncbi:A24 family peptidase [Burkholderia sp. TSV86]|uniref:A24 family peptidase n=1 Tax=Burkholderia sp. TSV86 TaxID=1385594 RepID=UPI000759B6F0|nr:prepilin peptidase [Burkholderia sp. TSV86]KVE30937.1 hypothetical protein WS68_17630 [Burkholderia sp. TSV86]